jgi:hypothetical protein
VEWRRVVGASSKEPKPAEREKPIQSWLNALFDPTGPVSLFSDD